jgi:hypothetical protein
VAATAPDGARHDADQGTDGASRSVDPPRHPRVLEFKSVAHDALK